MGGSARTRNRPKDTSAILGRRMSALRDSLPPGVGDIPETSRLWATFLDDAIKRQFQKESFESSTRRFAAFSVTLAVVAFLGYGIHDALVVPEHKNTIWLI